MTPKSDYSYDPPREEDGFIQVESVLSGCPRTPSGLEYNDTTLVVHFDINKTCLIGDLAAGDSREQGLNKIISKIAFVKRPGDIAPKNTGKFVPTEWWNQKKIVGVNEKHHAVPAPLYTGWEWPSEACPFYRTGLRKLHAGKFTDKGEFGQEYRNLFERLDAMVGTTNPLPDHAPKLMQNMFPALFHTMKTLKDKQDMGMQPVQFVFRTFGFDLPDVAESIRAFAKGEHPDYPDYVNPALELVENLLFRGRWTPDGSLYQLFKYDSETEVVAEGDEAIIAFLKGKPIVGIQDDYQYWAGHGRAPNSGKPVWVPARSMKQHHVFFDDNIHNLPEVSIAAVRVQESQGDQYQTLDGTETLGMQGLHLVRVPTPEPILNKNWFVEQISLAQDQYQKEP